MRSLPRYFKQEESGISRRLKPGMTVLVKASSNITDRPTGAKTN
jgi:hypothetical protein